MAMVQESKMNQAREIMKQKEKELKGHQGGSSGLSYFASFFTSAVSSVASSVRGADAAASRGMGSSSSGPSMSSVSQTERR